MISFYTKKLKLNPISIKYWWGFYWDIQYSKNTTNLTITTNTNATNNDNKREWVKTAIASDSMLNGVHEIGLSEAYNVKVNNYPGATRCSK